MSFRCVTGGSTYLGRPLCKRKAGHASPHRDDLDEWDGFDSARLECVNLRKRTDRITNAMLVGRTVRMLVHLRSNAGTEMLPGDLVRVAATAKGRFWLHAPDGKVIIGVKKEQFEVVEDKK